MVVHLFSPDGRYDDIYLRNYATLQVKDVLARVAGRRAGAALRLGRLRDARLARSATRSRRAASPPATSCAAIREQNVQVAAGVRRRSRRSAEPVDFQLLDQRARAASSTEEEFGDIIVEDRRRRRDHAACATSRASSSAPANTRCARLLNNKPAVAIPIFQRPGSNALAALRRRPRDDGRAEGELSRRASTTDRLRPDACSCASRSTRWS